MDGPEPDAHHPYSEPSGESADGTRSAERIIQQPDSEPQEDSHDDARHKPETQRKGPHGSKIAEAAAVWLRGYWDAPRQKSKWTEIFTVLLTMGLAGAAFWSAWVFQGQLSQMRIQTREELESFRANERAWVEVLPLAPARHSRIIPAVFSYDVNLRNSGKTGAHEIQLRVIPGKQGPVGNAEQPGTETFDQGLLFGKAPGTSDIQTVKYIPEALGPGEETTVPVVWRGAAPRGKGTGTIVDFLEGRVDYIDAFGIKHWRTFCFYIGDSKGTLRSCKHGNKEDQNPELPPN